MKLAVRVRRVAMAIVAMAGLAGGAVVAAPIQTLTLQDLIDNGGVTVGDKQFYDFTYTPSGTIPTLPTGPNPNPAAPRADQISVALINSPNIGLEFVFPWNSVEGYVMDSLIGYKIHVLEGSPQQYIDQVGLYFNGAVTGAGQGAQANVIETVTTLSGDLLGKLTVYATATDHKLTDTLDLDTPLRDIQVKKDIMVTSWPTEIGGGSTASISFVDNTYHQTPVPEPAMLSLLMFSGLIFLRRPASEK